MPRAREKELTKLARKVLAELERLALQRNLQPPRVYAIVFFDESTPPRVEGAVRLSDEVLVWEGVIAVKATELITLLVERVAAGYFALSLMASGETLDIQRVWRLARDAVIPVLASLAAG